MTPPHRSGLWLYIIKLHIPRNFLHVRLFSLSVAENRGSVLLSVPFSLSLVRFTLLAHRGTTCATKTHLTLCPNTAVAICKRGGGGEREREKEREERRKKKYPVSLTRIRTNVTCAQIRRTARLRSTILLSCLTSDAK